MNDKQKIAYEWAKSQNYPSVAARYAKELAGLVDKLETTIQYLFCEAEKKVKPLTLDELREAAETGDPVWLAGMEDGDGWVRIDGVYSLTIGYSRFGDAETWCFRKASYGIRVWAYRNKPEEVNSNDER